MVLQFIITIKFARDVSFVPIIALMMYVTYLYHLKVVISFVSEDRNLTSTMVGIAGFHIDMVWRLT
ncbi:hypothetical protein T440DRAFT_187020 [Plenodomus tracheiphilus IPT5]|uniref:Uncharacterized protein n=1 Tax=Plenodomus tracheiphilus IPT5 TaxID=1408161 RepID=A0A6A7AXF7_9PLEO|nr:hypothetical protein T440DRAFT_187020 [Plenodomus tracheiphilus IPT5]